MRVETQNSRFADGGLCESRSTGLLSAFPERRRGTGGFEQFQLKECLPWNEWFVGLFCLWLRLCS